MQFNAVTHQAIIDVLRVQDTNIIALGELLQRFGLILTTVDLACEIPGSYWGDSEAGLIGNQLYCRSDTPLHSVLHEASHFVCMDSTRRATLNKDAGGDFDEENAVCYLQILLANHITHFDCYRMCTDMDAWGYTFRLGSARAWFEQESESAQQWLQQRGLLDAKGKITWRCVS